jgi:hypothetical protein
MKGIRMGEASRRHGTKRATRRKAPNAQRAATTKPKSTPPYFTRPREIEWRIYYRRDGSHAQIRVMQTEHYARAFVEKLLRGNRGDLAPVVELHLQRRQVGPWVDVAASDDECVW